MNNIGEVVTSVGSIFTVLGFIVLVITWIQIDPGWFLWMFFLGVLTVGFGAIFMVVDLVANFINNYEKFFPAIVILAIGCLLNLIGTSIVSGF